MHDGDTASSGPSSAAGAVPPETAPVPVPPGVAARFRITGLIGKGGLATVYAATDTTLDREVAVKVFSAKATSSRAIRVQEAEAKLVASLNHYALTTLFDVGFDASDPASPQIYLVMEHIPGEDLKRRLARGPLTPAQVAYLGFDLAEGLAYVHEHGILHRDLKPANVLLADRGATTRLRGKLTDFGIATLIGVPDDGEYVTGTAAYLSPEVVEQRLPTAASDVYSLGLVLLEALTGRQEYPGEVVESAMSRLDRDPEVPAGVPAPMAALLTRMTARVVAARPTLAQVAAAFQAMTVDDLVAARQPRATGTDVEEEARLAAVRRYGILDTPPDEAFDRITDLARRLLGVPVAIVSIIDADRVWMKSRRGIEVRQLGRNEALGAALVEAPEPWAVRDVRSDPRTREVPYVVANPDLAGYAAAPLTTADGYVIGALCAFDRVPREFSAGDLAGLADLARIAVRELDLRLASRRALFDRD